MVDLHFADTKARASFVCSTCKPPVRVRRRCDDLGWDNLKKSIKIDEYSQGYLFCPGKATWDPAVVELFMACRIAASTGIMPKEGGLGHQTLAFPDALYCFIDRWADRAYARMWRDIGEFTAKTLQAILGKKGSGRTKPMEG